MYLSVTIPKQPKSTPPPAARSVRTSTTSKLEDSSDDDNSWIEGTATSDLDQSIDLEAESQDEEESEDEDFADIVSAVGTMTVSEAQVKNYSIGFTYPYLLYNYMDNKQLKCTVDLLVHTFPGENFNVKFNSDGSEILVYTKLPQFFTDVNRLKINNVKLTGNSSKVVAFEECVTKLGVDTDHEENLFGPPQRIKMPFKCDTKVPIEAEPQYFEAWGIDEEGQESGM